MSGPLRDAHLRRFAVFQFLLEVQLWFPVWLLFLTDRGFALPTIVAADAVFRVTIVALELPLGRFADLIGRRRSLLVVSASTVVAYLAIASVTSTVGLFAAWIIWGALWAMTSGTATAYLYELCRTLERSDDRVAIFGRVRAVTSTAVLLSHLFAGVLFSMSPTLPFLVTALLGGFAFMVAIRLPEVTRREGLPEHVPIRQVAPVAFGRRELRNAITLASIVLVFGWSVRILYQPLLLELDVAESLSGVSYFGYSAMGVLAGLFVGRLDRHRMVPMIVVGVVVLWVGVLGAGFVPVIGPWVFVPLMGFGFTLAWVLIEVVVNDRAPDAVRATVFSIVGVIGGIVIAGARPMLGVLADVRSPAEAFRIWALVGLVLAPVAVVALRGLGRTGPEQSGHSSAKVTPSTSALHLPSADPRTS